MKAVIDFFKLIRWMNLLFIILTQSLLQYLVIKPILAQAALLPTLSDFEFILLVLSTVFIAAAGYIINDYFDVKVDEINKPGKIFINRSIHRRAAMLLHWSFTGAGILLAVFLSWKVGKLQLALIHAVISGLLWFYSTGYKKQFLIGNIIVSLLTAMTLVIVLVYERNLFQPQEAAGMQAARTIFIITFFYFLFAFLISMYRELVKDMEDREGDAQFDCRTIAVVWGNQRTKLAALFFALCIFAGVIYIQLLQVKGGDFLSAFNLFIMAQVPLLISSHMLWRAKSQQQFAVVSQVIKLSMLLGILTMVYFYYLLV